MSSSCACSTDLAYLRAPSRPASRSDAAVLRLVDLFSGVGGLSLGFAEAARRLGMRADVILAVDSDPVAAGVYRRSLNPRAAFSFDVNRLFPGRFGDPLTLRERMLRSSLGRIDLLLGGPPCQGNSSLNNHTRGSDPRNSLYLVMARAAEVLRPAAVLIENVPGVIHDHEEVVEVTTKAMRAMGYEVAQSAIDLAGCGVPQRRRRHLVLATQADADPAGVLAAKPVCPLHPVRTVQWAIGDLESVPPDTELDRPARLTEDNKRRIDWLFDNHAFDLPNSLRPRCHRDKPHTYLSMYGRLRPDSPAQTITTGFGTMGQGRYVHPSRRRTLTPHEAARLQFLPDFIRWDGLSRGEMARLIGNAVPPAVGIAFGTALMPLLVDRSVEPAESPWHQDLFRETPALAAG